MHTSIQNFKSKSHRTTEKYLKKNTLNQAQWLLQNYVKDDKSWTESV